MTDTTYSKSADPVARHGRGAPRIAGTSVALPRYRYKQDEVARELTTFAEPGFMRFAQTSGVEWTIAVSRYRWHVTRD